MKLIDDDGTEIKISEETAQNIRDVRKLKEKLKEREFGYIRISETGNETSAEKEQWPIRISILCGQDQGFPMGKFGAAGSGTLPGYTLNKKRARAIAEYILELCNELEKK